jgi:hypothetical protein
MHKPDQVPPSAIIYGVAVIAAAGGFVSTSHAATAAAIHSAGAELTMLLRFMALVKSGFALGLVWLAAWRLGFPAQPGITAAYAAACALMPAGAGLIWGLAHVVAGAVLFHAGLLLMIGVGWVDQEDFGTLMVQSFRRRIPSGAAIPSRAGQIVAGQPITE